MTRHDVPNDLQHEFDRGTAVEENCKCGHTFAKHSEISLRDGGTTLRCNGHHMSGGISGMVQWCDCFSYQPYTEWVAERGWALCTGGESDCHRIVFAGGPRCDNCERIAQDAARDAWMEMS